MLLNRGRKVAIGLGAAALAGLVLWLTGFVGPVRVDGVFAPVFGPRDRYAWFLQREAEGFAVGFGIDGLTPRAWVRVREDRLRLVRVPLAGGPREVMADLGPTPLAGEWHADYRNRLFAPVRARLAVPMAGNAQWQVAIADWTFVGSWQAGGAVSGGWQQGTATAVADEEAMVRQPRELLAYPATAHYPAKLLLLDHDRADVRTLVGGEAPVFVALTEHSRYKRVVRQRAARAARERLEARFRASGLSEGDAAVRTVEALRALGYLPKPARWRAKRWENGDLCDEALNLTVAQEELDSGAYPDLAQALVEPGEEVARAIGDYPAFAGYDTSRRLNDFIAAGGRRLCIGIGARRYRVELLPPERADASGLPVEGG